ncbi:MAG TPA: amidohydrolase family protein [Armatimonadota bacterium]|jgi:predicted TIM-barrel fold metal-dependent hydrolase
MNHLDPLEQSLFEQIAALPVLDAHEHLPEESEFLATKHPDVFLLFGHYLHNDLITAGMTRAQYDSLYDPEIPLATRWASVRPFWQYAQHTSYAHAAQIAAHRLYGFDEISDATYEPLSAAIAADHTPGLYDRLLRQRCGIEKALTQIWRLLRAPDDLLIPLMPITDWTDVTSREFVAARAQELDGSVETLEEYVALMAAGLAFWQAEGVVGVKTISADLGEPDQPAAEAAWAALPGLAAPGALPPRALTSYLAHRLYAQAGELDLPVAVHCGYNWTNWGDFLASDPRFIQPTLSRYRATRFDLYHAGMPWVRLTGALGKSCPNAWLNLCWCYIMGEEMSCSLLDEWLDMVPVNKLIAFGGDYCIPHKVIGHLEMARVTWARVLARRLRRGRLSEQSALEIARLAFYENPKALYRE